jgi:hypothetical protein
MLPNSLSRFTVYLKVIRELQDSRTRGGTEHFLKRPTGITIPYLKYVKVIIHLDVQLVKY